MYSKKTTLKQSKIGEVLEQHEPCKLLATMPQSEMDVFLQSANMGQINMGHHYAGLDPVQLGVHI